MVGEEVDVEFAAEAHPYRKTAKHAAKAMGRLKIFIPAPWE
jgi:hypothetical protein